MPELSLIKDLAIIWACALIAGHICLRLKQPVLAGYMVTGIIVGPHCLKLIGDTKQIEVLAEFGVAMLLFALGVDLSIKQIAASAGRLIAVGASQLFFTTLVFATGAYLLKLSTSPAQAFLFGCVCAISSSVVISKMLSDRGEADSIHGRILIPLSLLQDLSLVLIIPFLPILASSGHGDGSLQEVGISALKAVGFIAFIVFGATRLLPSLLAQAARSNSRELFLLTLIVLCLFIALLSDRLGLSIALGAFLAGIMISESVFAHQALHDVQPLRDLFSVVFFVSVGMLLEPTFIFAHSLEVFVFVTCLITGKLLIGAGSALFATKNFRSAWLVGAGLAQIGEFSFILLTLGRSLGLISDYMYNLFFAGAVTSLIVSPSLMALVPKLLHRAGMLSGTKTLKHENQTSGYSERLKDHVIICGFGRVGRNLGMVLSAYQIPYIVIELNAGIIEDLAMKGTPHIYGDSTSPLVMIKANIKDAACLVLTMPDPSAIMAVTGFARERNQNVKIIARAHRQDDIGAFRERGANAVVQPEFEASIEITRLALHSRNRPQEEIEQALTRIRAQRYQELTPDFIEEERTQVYMSLDENQLGLWFINNFDKVTGKSPADLNVRKLTGVTITAVKRDSKTFAYPSPAMALQSGDELYAVGTSEQLTRFEQIFQLQRFSPLMTG
ncbi:MAG: cation:proton antiporter [Candidatus Obscuribacter sp.]|nr:cation:proton antiporter [Candidatus Obscuribacter sp.]MBK9619546.1 cation:proton antiporter [Candidatus Obscuribacter sp.]